MDDIQSAFLWLELILGTLEKGEFCGRAETEFRIVGGITLCAGRNCLAATFRPYLASVVGTHVAQLKYLIFPKVYFCLVHYIHLHGPTK